MEAFAQSIKEKVLSTFSTTHTSPESHPVSKSEIRGLEEHERARRLEQVSQSRVDQLNAANLACLIKEQRFPVFRGNVSKGYKRVTIKFEEEERRRRQTNKAECALRRANANKTARMLQRLGWPFYQQENRKGPEYIVMDPAKQLEEEEREWRINNPYWASFAKHNAATVANILRWNNFQRNPKMGFRTYTRNLEEKERTYRLQPTIFTSCMESGYREANLIRHMGYPFYVQQPAARRDFTEVHKLEEEERKRRMRNPTEQQMARELAGIVSESLHGSQKEIQLEEAERGRRLVDVPGQRLAKENAKQVSLMVRESSTNKVSGPMWFTISRNSMRALEEIERTRRLRDFEWQAQAKQHAKKLSAILLEGLANSTKPGFVSLEEEERQARILDRTQQHLAMKNARKVSGLIAKHFLFSTSSKSYALAMEESERSRRIMDGEHESLARANARKVSGMVSSLSSESIQQKPLPSLPTGQAPATSVPPLQRPLSPLVAAAPRAQTTYPVNPLYSQAAPVVPAIPLATAPVVLPAAALPLASPPATQLPAIPLQRPASFTSATPAVPLDSLVPAQAPLLGDRERKKLQKEAERHKNKYEKDIRKAEQRILKAEKMHQKGRDDKAVKLENQAEHLRQMADHERKWASGLEGELQHNTPAPASM